MHGRLSRLYNLFSKHVLFKGRIFLEAEEEIVPGNAAAFKTYPRFANYPLPKPSTLSTGLEAALRERRSFRSYERTASVSLQNLSTLLQHAGGIPPARNGGGRTYPSGGALYPLEIYLAHQGSSDLPAGLYHYDVRRHALEQLGGADRFEEARASLTWEFSKKAPTVLILTAVWERNFKKYQEFGYPLVLLEAGHLGQNVQLVATALGLASCPLAGFLIDELSKALDIDPLFEAPVHVVALAQP